MKIIDAFWEKRNLGVETVEFNIYGPEPMDEVKNAIVSNEKEYSVIKVRAGYPEYHFLAASLGYCYIETLFNVVKKLDSLPLSPIQKRVSDSINCRLVKEQKDIDGIFREIQKGIFTTDRIALDPEFSVDIANRRYVGWIGDELSRGSEIYAMELKGKDIGFFMIKDEGDDVCFPFLAGMYTDYLQTGGG